jgi:hypothetical protein
MIDVTGIDDDVSLLEAAKKTIERKVSQLYEPEGNLLSPKSAVSQVVEKTRAGKVPKPTFPPRLEIPQSARDSHFPTTSATAG